MFSRDYDRLFDVVINIVSTVERLRIGDISTLCLDWIRVEKISKKVI